MARIVQFRRGTTSSLSTILGAPGELFVDTSLVTVVVHDGVTTGGVTLARNADVQTLSSTTATNFTSFQSSTTSSIAYLSSVAATQMTNSIFGVGRPDTTSLTTVTSGVIAIATGSNGYGARTVQSSASGVPSNATGNNGDIIYQY
jgi:hypothetical protein